MDMQMTIQHQLSLEFDWVLLIPGPGHVEMNLLKSIVEFTWDIFWRQMVITLNFRSENAQKAAKRVSDHHKGWSLLRIARIALAKELVLPFVRLQLAEEHADLSVVNFMRFISRDVKDPNFLLIADIVFEFLDSICMYRCGVSTGNFEFMHVARAKAAKIWSARHHPSYREIELADSLWNGLTNMLYLYGFHICLKLKGHIKAIYTNISTYKFKILHKTITVIALFPFSQK